jgi:hypothetical protein
MREPDGRANLRKLRSGLACQADLPARRLIGGQKRQRCQKMRVGFGITESASQEVKLRKKLIAGAIVAAALAVPATPAFAIHDPFVPAGNSAAPGSKAVGHGTGGHPNQPNRGVSNTFALLMAADVRAQGGAHCQNNR